MNLKNSLIISDMELQDRVISAFLDYHVITVKYTGDKQNNYTSKKTTTTKKRGTVIVSITQMHQEY